MKYLRLINNRFMMTLKLFSTLNVGFSIIVK
jgi:hypothetical protein